MSVIDDIRQNRMPVKHADAPKIGRIWMHMLIEYDWFTGESKILRSFNNPAKESDIKAFRKSKKIEDAPKMEITNNTDAEELF